MDAREYNLVSETNTCANRSRFKNQPSWWKEASFGIGAWTTGFLLGIAMGTNTVAIPQMQEESMEITDEIRSWLGAVFAFGGLLWLILLTPIINKFGVKRAFITVYTAALFGSTVNYFATSPIHFICGQAILSVLQTSFTTVTIMVVTEYTSTRNRALFLTMKSASMYWGIWVANAIGTFFNWRNIPVTSMICSLYGVTVCFWPESPYWLASKGRLDECAQSFRWIRGVNEETELELQNVIEYYSDTCQRRANEVRNLKDLYNCITSREFYMPLFLCFTMSFLYMASGKSACTMFALELLKYMTKDNKSAYTAMLIIDGVNVLGMYCGCFVMRKFRRKISLIILSAIGITFLFLMSIHKYLIIYNIIVDDFRVSLTFLILFSFALCVGPIILVPAAMAELVPLKGRLIFYNMMSVNTKILFGIFIKMAPSIFKLGLNIAFLIHGCLSTLALVLLIIFLPETKGKTSVELNKVFRKSKKISNDEIETKAKLMPIINKEV